MSGARCAALVSRNPHVHEIYKKQLAFFHFVPATVQAQLCALIRDTDWVEMFLKMSRDRLREHANIVMGALEEMCIPFVEVKVTLLCGLTSPDSLNSTQLMRRLT